MANRHHHLGGLANVPLLGDKPTVERFVFWWNFPAIFVGNILFGFSVFSLGLYFIFRNRWSLLYAALFGVAAILRLLFSDALPVSILSTEMPFSLVMSLRFMTLPYMGYFVALYLFELYPNAGGDVQPLFKCGCVLQFLSADAGDSPVALRDAVEGIKSEVNRPGQLRKLAVQMPGDEIGKDG